MRGGRKKERKKDRQQRGREEGSKKPPLPSSPTVRGKGGRKKERREASVYVWMDGGFFFFFLFGGSRGGGRGATRPTLMPPSLLSPLFCPSFSLPFWDRANVPLCTFFVWPQASSGKEERRCVLFLLSVADFESVAWRKEGERERRAFPVIHEKGLLSFSVPSVPAGGLAWLSRHQQQQRKSSKNRASAPPPPPPSCVCASSSSSTSGDTEKTTTCDRAHGKRKRSGRAVWWHNFSSIPFLILFQ